MRIENFIHAKLFKISHTLPYPNFFNQCDKLSHKLTKAELSEKQNQMLKEIVNYSYDEVMYYHDLFNSLKLAPKDIQKTSDLEKLPILTKEDVKKSWKDFRPKNLNKISFTQNSTGGTTGIPFVYRISKEDRFLSLALLYRGWKKAGYKYADRMVFLAGASLDISSRSSLTKFVHEKVRNIKKLSSFEMNDFNLRKYVDIINYFKPLFIRGYPSAIYYFSHWIKDNNIKIHSPKAVFVTSEKLYPHIRDGISETFKCDVYDAYGLNDGGLSAFECSLHKGLHLDTERSYAEVVNDTGEGTMEKEGRIIATNLVNTAMPLIRYDTGDIGVMTTTLCECGDSHPILKEITGRSVDILITPEGTAVHGWFFQHTFWRYHKGIKEYQVVQNTTCDIDIFIVKDEQFESSIIEDIRSTARNISPRWVLNFKYVEQIPRTNSGKFKFIINNIK